MPFALAKNWWSLTIRGFIAILFAIFTFAWPGVTLTALVLLFAAYALMDGVVSIIGAVRAERAHEKWAVLFFEGIVGLGAAVATVFWPAITLLALVYIIAAWAIITGGAEVAAAIRLRRHISGEWLLALSGFLSVGFGFLLMVAPLAGAIVLALWVGVYLLIFGVVLVALGFKLRSWRRGPVTRHGFPAPAH